MYALLGRKGARVVTWIVIAALAALSFKWTGWLLWLALVVVFGRQQDMPLDDLTELTVGRASLRQPCSWCLSSCSCRFPWWLCRDPR